MTGDAPVRIDYDKVAKDKCMDGYKGYTTNSTLTGDMVKPTCKLPCLA